MQVTLYSAWEVRTPISDDETFNEAKTRIEQYAVDLGIAIKFRKGKGQRFQTPRFHYWEVSQEQHALALMMGMGDVVKATMYPIENLT